MIVSQHNQPAVAVAVAVATTALSLAAKYELTSLYFTLSTCPQIHFPVPKYPKILSFEKKCHFQFRKLWQ
jgi:hypothetical protein